MINQISGSSMRTISSMTSGQVITDQRRSGLTWIQMHTHFLCFITTRKWNIEPLQQTAGRRVSWVCPTQQLKPRPCEREGQRRSASWRLNDFQAAAVTSGSHTATFTHFFSWFAVLGSLYGSWLSTWLNVFQWKTEINPFDRQDQRRKNRSNQDPFLKWV